MGDIFTGSKTYLMYCDDLTNTSPKNTNFTQLKNLATFPTFQQTSEIKKIETYNSEYSNIQLVSMNIEPITITLNYVLDDQVLDQYYNNGNEFQLMLCMEDSDDVLNYIILNGQITSTQIDGDKDSAVTKTYTFEPNDIQARGSMANTELYRGDYGVGSDGVDYSHNTTSSGNGFFLLDKNASNNSLGVDLIGTQTVNNGKTSQMLITDTGTNPILRIRSNNGQLVKVYSSVEKPTLGELGGVSLTDLNTAKSELKLYTDTTYPTKASVSTDISTFKTYSDTTFSTKIELSNGLNTKLNLAGGTLTGGLLSKVPAAITFTPMDNTSYNWLHWTQTDGTQGWRIGRLENNGGLYIRDYSAGGVTALDLKKGEFILTSATSGNTPWINLTLQNGWKITAGGYRAVYRRVFGLIFVEATIDSGSLGSGNLVIFTLPPGYRPSGGPLVVPSAAANSTTFPANVIVRTNGEVQITGVTSNQSLGLAFNFAPE